MGIFSKFGAVEVSGKNFYRLLQAGEAGGVIHNKRSIDDDSTNEVRALTLQVTSDSYCNLGPSACSQWPSCEAVLLYPGGAREVYKNKGEDYRLFW
jgi:hypothetical protein